MTNGKIEQKKKIQEEESLVCHRCFGFLLSDRFESKDKSVLEKKTKQQMLLSRGS